MARSQETFNKKEVRNKKEKKRKDKEAKRLARKEAGKSKMDDMIAYVNHNGEIVDTPPDPTLIEEIDSESISITVAKRVDEPEELVRQGSVTFFNDTKGFGFIKDSITKESIFVHINNVEGDLELKENNIVNFEVEMGQKGPTAVNVKLAK